MQKPHEAPSSRTYLNNTTTEQAIANSGTGTGFAANALTAAATFNEAAFAVQGMLFLLQGSAISQTIQYWLAMSSGFAALSIECEVFYENITSGLEYAYTKDGLKLKIVSDIILSKYNEDPTTDNELLKQYAQHFIALEKLTGCHNHGPVDDEKAWKKNLLKFELMQMDRTLLNYFEGNDSNIAPKIKTLFDDLFQDKKDDFHNTYWWKNKLLQTSTALNILSLPGCFFAASFMAKELLVFALGATGVALTAGTFIIALIACASFFVMMYSTFCDLIYNDLLQKHYTQLQHIWYNLDRNGKDITWEDKDGNTHTWGLMKKLFIRSAVVLVSAAFAALIVLLTLATAGTWVQAGLSGQVFLLNLANTALNTAIIASTSLYTAIVVVFNIKNIMATISFMFSLNYINFTASLFNQLTNKLSSFWNDLFDETSAFQKYQAMQFFIAPLALLAFGLRTLTAAISAIWFGLTLLVHCASEGLTTDKGFFISVWLSALSNGIAELFTDLPYITDCQTERDLEMGKKLDPNHEGAHQHTGVLGTLFFIAMSPILFTNYTLSRWLTAKSADEAWKTHITPFWDGHSHAEGDECSHGHSHTHDEKEHKDAHGHGHSHGHETKHHEHGCHKKETLPSLSQFWDKQIEANMENKEPEAQCSYS